MDEMKMHCTALYCTETVGRILYRYVGKQFSPRNFRHANAIIALNNN